MEDAAALAAEVGVVQMEGGGMRGVDPYRLDLAGKCLNQQS